VSVNRYETGGRRLLAEMEGETAAAAAVLHEAG
jgi:hypothetical protein